jgi:hypothetical protein
MNQNLANMAHRQRRYDQEEHPWWCAQDHRCTALTLSDGAHISNPEIWTTLQGWVIATRHRTRGDWVELHTILQLPADEQIAEAKARHLLAVTALVVERVFSPDPIRARAPR